MLDKARDPTSDSKGVTTQGWASVIAKPDPTSKRLFLASPVQFILNRFKEFNLSRKLELI